MSIAEVRRVFTRAKGTAALALINVLGFQERDISEKDDFIELAIVELLKRGEAVPVCFGEVYALIADARNSRAVDEVRRVKHRSVHKPFAVLTSSATTAKLVDLDRVSAKMHKFFEKESITRLFGAKGFMRFPVKDGTGLDVGVIGPRNNLQTFTFEGDPIAFRLEQILTKALSNLHSNGNGEVLITSFNMSGEPSIVMRADAIELSKKRKMKLLVHRDASSGRGSYSIYNFHESGVEKIRHGTGADKIDRELESDSI